MSDLAAVNNPPRPFRFPDCTRRQGRFYDISSVLPAFTQPLTCEEATSELQPIVDSIHFSRDFNYHGTDFPYFGLDDFIIINDQE